MTTNLIRFLTGEHPNYLLGGVGIVLLILGAWLVLESIVVLLKPKQETQLEITF